MKTLRILTIASAAAATVLLSSCGCCTGEAKAPPLRPLPQFADIPVAPTK
ncbi:MAG: hypothetical protein ABGY95_09085 [Rubritalea sp.]